MPTVWPTGTSALGSAALAGVLIPAHSRTASASAAPAPSARFANREGPYNQITPFLCLAGGTFHKKSALVFSGMLPRRRRAALRPDYHLRKAAIQHKQKAAARPWRRLPVPPFQGLKKSPEANASEGFQLFLLDVFYQ